MEVMTMERVHERTAASRNHPMMRSVLLDIAEDVACLPLSIVNVYFFGKPHADDRSWVLIDAGLSWSRGAIEKAAEQRFGRGSRPAAIILTHGHFDHVGALPDLADQWNVPIYAHPLEMPYLTGRSSYPPPDPSVGGGAMAWLSPLYPRGPYNFGDYIRPLPEDGSVPGMPGWRWIHTPGHSAGHVSLFREADRILIAGDAFVTQRQESALAVILQHQEISRPPAYYTADWEAARKSVEALSRLQPEVAATGHGIPMSGQPMRRQLEELVRNWDKVAVPPHGRYVHQPAIMDAMGVVSVPPAVVDPRLIALAGVGIAALVGGLLLPKRRS